MNTIINALLIDDEKGNHATLMAMLKMHWNINVVACASNTLEATDLIKTHKIDVVFLDIQMPKQNGLQWLQSIVNIDFEIIFVTAFDAYALQAIKFSALDYVLKPIDANELQIAIGKLEIRINEKKTNENLKNLLHFMNHQQEKTTHKIALPTTSETFFVNTLDIIFAESSNSYTTFYLLDYRKIMVSKSIKEYEMLLADYGFIRVHQSYLVNKEMIIGLNKKDGFLLKLKNEFQVPLSKAKKESVIKLLGVL